MLNVVIPHWIKIISIIIAVSVTVRLDYSETQPLCRHGPWVTVLPGNVYLYTLYIYPLPMTLGVKSHWTVSTVSALIHTEQWTQWFNKVNLLHVLASKEELSVEIGCFYEIVVSHKQMATAHTHQGTQLQQFTANGTTTDLKYILTCYWQVWHVIGMFDVVQLIMFVYTASTSSLLYYCELLQYGRPGFEPGTSCYAVRPFSTAPHSHTTALTMNALSCSSRLSMSWPSRWCSDVYLTGKLQSVHSRSARDESAKSNTSIDIHWLRGVNLPTILVELLVLFCLFIFRQFYSLILHFLFIIIIISRMLFIIPFWQWFQIWQQRLHRHHRHPLSQRGEFAWHFF